jgi:hypothetical protein
VSKTYSKDKHIFQFQATERREVAQMDRVATQMDNAAAQQMQANADANTAMTGMISGLGNIGAAYMNNQSAEKIAGVD